MTRAGVFREYPVSLERLSFFVIQVGIVQVLVFDNWHPLKVTEWPPIGKIAAHSAYEMFSWYKHLIVSLVFSHLGFWSGSLFLIAPFPDLCLLVLFHPITIGLNDR